MICLLIHGADGSSVSESLTPHSCQSLSWICGLKPDIGKQLMLRVGGVEALDWSNAYRVDSLSSVFSCPPAISCNPQLILRKHQLGKTP